MAHRRSPPFVPVLAAGSSQQSPTVPSLETKNSDPSSADDNGRVALLRRQSSSGTSDADSEIASRMRKKAEPVKSACAQCQKRKTKCSGDRPICRFCHDRGLECSWDIGDGMTRTADLKQKLQVATGRGEKLKRLLSDEATRGAAVRQKLEAAEERQEDLSRLMEAMRSSTDQVSTMLLARLRLGEPIEDLIESVRGPGDASHGESASNRPGLRSNTHSSGSGSSGFASSGSGTSSRSSASSNVPTLARTSAPATPPMMESPKHRTGSGQSDTSAYSAPRAAMSRPSLMSIDTRSRPSYGGAETWTPSIKQEDLYMSPTSPTGDGRDQDVDMSGMHEDWHASADYTSSQRPAQGQQQPQTPPLPPAGFER
nr:hypothetical protein B0A51_05383 [Rachicladosporium sp. CCFEE 5018]